ncbi:hypothetical protein, partial [Hydrogenophaga palleronii]|uniref:hypothetical protein n=1 Tax=Hydrogenophaga palleronii TaxID=65655 RepID=UPI00286B8C1D
GQPDPAGRALPAALIEARRQPQHALHPRVWRLRRRKRQKRWTTASAAFFCSLALQSLKQHPGSPPFPGDEKRGGVEEYARATEIELNGLLKKVRRPASECGETVKAPGPSRREHSCPGHGSRPLWPVSRLAAMPDCLFIFRS